MDLPESVQRLWRLSQQGSDCIGAIVEGYVPGLTTPDEEGQFVAFVSFAAGGKTYARVEPNGRVVYVMPLEGNTRQGGVPCKTLAEGLIELEKLKEMLLADGWTEIQLDAIGDPD